MAENKNIIDNVDNAYQAELKKIALISNRFNAFMDEVVKNYPSDKTRKLHLVSTLITEIVEKNDVPTDTAKQKVEEVYRLIDEYAPKTTSKESEI